MAMIMHAEQRMGGRGKIWLLTTCEPTNPNCATMTRLMNETGAVWTPNYINKVVDVATDLWIGMNVPGALIGSYGTYSWVMAYAGKAKYVYLPFDRLEPSPWNPGCDLFIHDDPRVYYGELKNTSNIVPGVEFNKTVTDAPWVNCFTNRKPIDIQYDKPIKTPSACLGH